MSESRSIWEFFLEKEPEFSFAFIHAVFSVKKKSIKIVMYFLGFIFKFPFVIGSCSDLWCASATLELVEKLQPTAICLSLDLVVALAFLQCVEAFDLDE